MKKIYTIFFTLLFLTSFSQITKKALFLGNSYTNVNDLPTLIENIATANGDMFMHDQNTPGGYQLVQHSTNTTTLSKIASDDWDYVILQEQSQKPSFPPAQVATDVKPYAVILNDSIKSNNSCSETLFFMTWGRVNGDQANCAGYPPLCTYSGMQQRLRESYLEMTIENNADCAPVGVAWKKVREDFPAINLYATDGSHPTIYGSYLAACVFYTSMYNKSTIGTTFWSSLDSLTAFRLQTIATETVLDSLSVWSIETSPTSFDIIDSIIFTCDSVEVNGNWYDTDFSDTISGVGLCETVTNYEIQIGIDVIDSLIQICDSIEVLGNWYNTDTAFIDTISGNPCDVIVNFEIEKIETQIDTFITVCDSIEINNNWYYNDTIFTDTVFGSPCVIIYNYELYLDTSVIIKYFSEAFFLKTNSYGFYNLIISVENADSMFLYKNSVLFATYPGTLNFGLNHAYLACDYENSLQNFKLIVKNKCSIDSAFTTTSCKNYWGGINGLDGTNWQIFPNPANNFIEIYTQKTEDFSVSLIDITGKILISKQESKSQKTKIDVSIFEKGIYFIVLYDKDNMPIGQKRVIIN